MSRAPLYVTMSKSEPVDRISEKQTRRLLVDKPGHVLSHLVAPDGIARIDIHSLGVLGTCKWHPKHRSPSEFEMAQLESRSHYGFLA